MILVVIRVDELTVAVMGILELGLLHAHIIYFQPNMHPRVTTLA